MGLSGEGGLLSASLRLCGSCVLCVLVSGCARVSSPASNSAPTFRRPPQAGTSTQTMRPPLPRHRPCLLLRRRRRPRPAFAEPLWPRLVWHVLTFREGMRAQGIPHACLNLHE